MQLRLSHPSSLHCVLLLFRVDCLKLFEFVTRTFLNISSAAGILIPTVCSEHILVTVSRHVEAFLELNASITLLPMQKFLIIEISVCKWLHMSDVLS
jgi:hypothetical protein